MEAELPARRSQRDFGNEDNRCKKTKKGRHFPKKTSGQEESLKRFEAYNKNGLGML